MAATVLPEAPRFHVTATSMLDVATEATVTLIDTVSNASKGSTLSDSNGVFNLQFGGGLAVGTRPYFLEAVKGLSGNSAGRDAARVRTVVRFAGGSWQSLTPGELVVSRATTAVSALVSHKGLTEAQQDGLFGKVGTSGEPPTFDASTGVISALEYTKTFDFVTKALAADRDPIDSLLWDSNTQAVYLRPGVGVQPPVIMDVFPNPAAVGDTVFIVGRAFGASLASNAVDFGGVQATPSALVSDRIEVVVPPGARSGVLTVATPDGVSGFDFRVVPSMSGAFLGI